MKKRYAAIILTMFMSVTLAGCGLFGSKPADDAQEAGPETEQTDSSADTSDSASPDSATVSNDAPSGPAASSPADEMIGEWEFVCTIYHSEYDNGDVYDYCTMLTDPDAPDSRAVVRRDGDRLVADYKYDHYESSFTMCGSELVYREDSPYRGSESSWCMEMTDPFRDANSTSRMLSLNDRGMLIESEVYIGEGTDEYNSYYSVNTTMFLPKGAEQFDHPEDLAYFDTVRVSSATELLNSVANNRKIILEAGRYDLSDVLDREITNPGIGEGYGSYTFDKLNNLCIEPAEGADVLICIDSPYDPVLWFRDGNNITLKNLTVGHDVEPGYCSGSVLNFEGISGVHVSGCKLYGSGTYGVEASNSYNITVEDTDIYECTYGLVNMYSIGSALFKNCVMRDSSEFAMIDISSAYDVTFEDCQFKNNRCESDYYAFVNLGEYDSATFRNCSFSNNKYTVFSNREVTMENCTSDGNYVGFGDMINEQSVSSAEDIQKLYDQAVEKQKEIDDRISGDAFMDQLSLNQTAYEAYELWDSLINRIWAYLGENLSEEEMTSLTEEQRAWIKEKEARMKEAGADFEGGSMQPMIEYSNGADITRERVEVLIGRYISSEPVG